MAHRGDQTLPRQNVYNREYQTRFEERTGRISSSSGHSTPTFMHTTSRENNPSLKLNEYLSLSQQLMRWLREAIVELSRRDFPRTLSELKDVVQQFERFRTIDVGKKSQDRYLLANMFDDLQNTRRQYPIKAEQHINEVNKLWNEFVMALQEKDSAIHIELTRLQKLETLADKVQGECNKCRDLLDNMEAKLMAVQKWGYGSKSALVNLKQLQCSIEEMFQLLFNDLKKLQQAGCHDLSPLAKTIQSLRMRYSTIGNALLMYMESGNSSDTSTYEDSSTFMTNHLQGCFHWLKEKEREMDKAGYGSDLRSSFDNLELQKKWHQDIKDFQSSIQDCINAKKNFPIEQHHLYNKQLSQLELLYIQLQSTSNFRLGNLRTLVSFLKDSNLELEWMKTKESEASDYVSSFDATSKELEKLNNFGMEVNAQGGKFESLLERGDALIRDQHPASNKIQFFCNLLQVQRAWLLQLSKCVDVHVKSIRSYKQFHDELVEVDKWLTKQLHLVDGLSGKQDLSIDEAKKIIDAFVELKRTVQHYENVISTISRQAENIPSIKVSSESFPLNAPIKALCSYKISNFSISEGERCILLSDSFSSKWKVRNSSGIDGILPSVCFIACAPNEETGAFVSRLKKNYLELTNKVDSMLSKLYRCLSSQVIQKIKSLNAVMYQELSEEERSILRNNLNDSCRYLMSFVGKDSSSYDSLQRDFSTCQQAIEDFEQRAKMTYSKPNTSVIILNDFGRVMQNIDIVEHIISLNSQMSLYPSNEKFELAKKQLVDVEKNLKEIELNLEAAKDKYFSMNPSQRTTTIEDMYNKLMEKSQYVLQMQRTLSKRLELTSEFVSGKSKIETFLRTIEDSLLQFPSLSSKSSQVDEVRQNLQKFKSDFMQNHNMLDDLEMKSKSVKQLASKPQSTGAFPYSDGQNIYKDLNGIKFCWDALQQEIIQRKSIVDQAYESLTSYKNEERTVNNILSEYENSFDTITQDPSLDLVKSTDDLVSLFKNVKSFRFKMEGLNKNVQSFLREVKAYEDKSTRLHKNITRKINCEPCQQETVSDEVKLLNNRYSFLFNSLKQNLTLRKPILDKLKYSYVLESEKEMPSFQTYQSKIDTLQHSGTFEVPPAMEEHFQAEKSWSQLNVNQLTSTEEESIYSENKLPAETFQDDSSAVQVDLTESLPQEEHMHSEDMEEFLQPIKDGEEKITKHTKQEFHSRKTPSGFESISTHEKKLLSLVSTEALAYSGKIKFPLEVTRAIQYQLLDPQLGIFTHPDTSGKMPLVDAIERKLLLIEDAVFVCPTSMKSYSLRDAFKLKLLDSHGFFSSLDSVTNFDQLIKNNFLKFKSKKKELIAKAPQQVNRSIKITSTPATAEKMYFAISSVIDPSSKKLLDAFTGVQRGILDQANALYNGKDLAGNVVQIPIRDAVRLGLVFADETLANGFKKNKLIKETRKFTLTGVMDPISRKKLTVIEAVNSGYLDQLRGLFIDPIKRISIPITEAISLGHVLAEVAVSSIDDDERSLKKIVTSKEVALTISSVINPFNGKEISGSDAIKMGIFDPTAGEYKNLKTNESMSLNEAIDKKLVKVVQGKPKQNDLSREEKVVSLHIDDEMDAREEMAHEEIVEERRTFQITGVKEPRSGKFISFLEAVACRLIDEGRGLYRDYVAKTTITIPEALERGFIIGTTQTFDQQELFKSAIVAHKKEDITGVFNPIIDKMVSVNEALQLGLLNKDMTLYFDPASNEVLKMDVAIRKGYVKSRDKSESGKSARHDIPDECGVTQVTKVTIDWSGGRVLNRMTKEEIPISKALEFGLIEDYIAAILRMKNPEKTEEKVEEKKENDSVSMKMTVQVTYLKDESGRIIIEDEVAVAGEELNLSEEPLESYSGMSLHDAVILGLYDIRKGAYYDPFSKKALTLRESIEAGCINPLLPALIDISNGKHISLNALIEDGIISLLNGTISLSKLLNLGTTLDPNFLNFLSHTVNLEDAIRCGLFDEVTGLFQQPFSGKTFDLETAIKNDSISSEASVVLNPLTGERLPLSKAIETNVVNGKTGRFTDSTLEKNITLSRAIILGLIKQRYRCRCSSLMDLQTGETSSLEECIDLELVDLHVPCIYSPSSKSRISLAAAASEGLIDKARKTYFDQVSQSELSLSDAAKCGLIQFPGAPVLSSTNCISDDITQSSLQTNVSLLKGARLLENIMDSFGDAPSMGASKDFTSLDESRKISELSTDVCFLKDDPDKKVFETKTFDKNTDETPVSIVIANDGSLIATQRIVDKVQKSQVKETLESINGNDSRKLSYLSDIIGPPPTYETLQKSESQHKHTQISFLDKVPSRQTHKSAGEQDSNANSFKTAHESNPVVEDFDFESAARATQETFKSSSFQPIASSVTPSSPTSLFKPVVKEEKTFSKSKKELFTIVWKTGNVIDISENKILSSKEAFEKGFIDAHIKEILDKAATKAQASTPEQITLNDALDKGLLNVPLSKVRNVSTNENLTIEEAVAMNYIDLDRSVVIDPFDRRPRSLNELVECHIFNIENAVMKNMVSEKIMTLSDIVQMKLIPPKGLPDVSDVRVMTFNEALSKGLLNEHTNQFTEESSGFDINLETALRIGYLKHDPKERFSSRTKKHKYPTPLTLLEAFKSGILSFETFLYTNPYSGETLALEDAISRRLILVPEFDNSSDVDGIDFETAYKRGYVDILDNIFIDPITGVLVPLDAAIKKGYVILPRKSLDAKVTVFNNESPNERLCAVSTRYLGFSDLPLEFGDALLCGLYDEVAGTFSDPYESGPLTLEEALQYNLIKDSSMVKDPMSGKWISLLQAMKDGHIDPISGKFVDPVSFSAIALKEAEEFGMFYSAGPCLWIGKFQNSDQLSSGTISFKIVQILDPINKCWISPEEGIKMGYLSLYNDFYADPTNNRKQNLFDAMNINKIKVEVFDAKVAHISERTYLIKSVIDPLSKQEISPNIAEQKRILDMSDRTYYNFYDRSKVSLHEAHLLGLIKANKFDGNQSFKYEDVREVMDYTTGKKMTLTQAVNNNLIDSGMSYYIDPQSGQKLTLYEAWRQGYLFLKSDYKYNTKSKMIKSVIDTRTGEEIPISDAIRHQIVDIVGNKYWNLKTNTYMDLDYAIAKRFVLIEPAGKAVKKSDVIEVEVQSDSGAKVYVIKSVKDPSSAKEFDPVEAERRGYINKVQGVYMNTLTGMQISIKKAIDQGLICASLVEDPDYEVLKKNEDAYAVFESSKNLKEITSVVDPITNEKVSLFEGIRRGFLDFTRNSKNVLSIEDSSNRDLSLSSLSQSSYLCDFDDYTFTVVDPLFFTVPGSLLDGRLTADGAQLERGALSRGDSDKEPYFDPISSEAMSILEGLSSGKLLGDGPAMIDAQFDTFSKKQKRIPENDAKLSNNKSMGLDTKYSSQTKYPTDGRESSHVSDTYWKSGFASNMHVKSNQSLSHDDGSTVSKEDLESLDQLLAELEQGKGDDLGLQNHLKVDDAVLTQPKLRQEKASSDKAFYQFSSLASSQQTTKPGSGGKTGRKNGTHLNDSLSDLVSEDPNEELVVKEDGRFESLNLDSEKTSSAGRPASIASASDYGKEQFFTLDELVRLNLYDRSFGVVCNPETGNKFPLLEAIERGIVHKNSVKLCDPASGRLITLTEAFERGIMDAENGNITDVYTGKVFKFSETVNKALDLERSSGGEVPCNQSKPKSESLGLCSALERNYFDGESRRFKFPDNSERFTLKEAIEEGLINTRSAAIKDLESGNKTFLDTVIALGLVDLERGLFKDTRGCFVAVEKAFHDKILVDCEITPRPYTLQALLDHGLYSKDSDSFFDPDAKQFVSLKDAISRNLLDPKSVICIDSSNSEVVSLNEAIARNFIGSDVKRNSLTLSAALDKGVALKKPIPLSKAIDIGLLNETTGKFLDPVHRKFFILKETLENGFISDDSKIADPSTRKLISLSRAISLGIVNPNNGTVVNIHTNETSSLKEACTSAKLLRRKLSPDTASNQPPTENVEARHSHPEVTFPLISKNSENILPFETSISETGEFLYRHFKISTNLEDAIKTGVIDPNSCLISLPWSNEILSLGSLIEHNLIDLRAGVLIQPSTNERYSFPSVVLKESVDPNVNNFSLAEALDLGVFNPETGLATDPNTEKKMSLFESLKSSLISYQKTALVADGELTNLLGAVSSGLLDGVRGNVRDVKSNRMMTFLDALQRGLVLDAYIPPKFSFEQMCNAGLYDKATNSFVNPFTKKRIGLEECLGLDLLDANKCFVFLPDSKKSISLMTAFNQKLLSSDLNLITDPATRNKFATIKALDGSLEKSDVHQLVMQDSEVKTLEQLIQKLEIYRDWVSDAYQQIGIFQITANKGDLGGELKRLHNFSAVANEIKPDMVSLHNQMEKVLESQGHHFDKTRMEKLKMLNQGVRNQYNLLLENVKNQVKLLTSCHEELVKYEDEKQKFETWLNTAVEDIDSKFSNFKHTREVASQKEALKNFVDEIFIRQGDLKYVEICKNQFLDQARHFDAMQLKSKNLKRSSSHLDLLYSMVDDLRQLTNEYNSLRASSRLHLDRVEALNDCLKRVEDIDRQIKLSLNEIEQSAEYLYKQQSKKNLKTDVQKQLKSYSSEMQSQYLFFDKLKTIVNDLIKQLSQFGSTDHLQKEINDKVNNLEEHIKHVDEVLNAKSIEMNSLPDSQSMADDVKELSSLVGSAECLVEEMDRKKVMLDEDLMIGRIKEMKTLGREISNLHQPLTNLMQTGSSGTMIRQLHKRYTDVVSKFSRKEKELEDVFTFVSGFNSNMRNLKKWMNNLLGKIEVKETSPEDLKALLEDIVHKSEEFTKLRDRHEEYLERLDIIAGKEKLKEAIEETQVGLSEVENLCLTRISQEEKKEELETTFKRLKDKIVLWITEKEDSLTSEENEVWTDMKLLNEGIEDFHNFKDYIDELNDTCLGICELLTDCDHISSAHQRLKRYFKKGLRSPSPISFAMKHFDFEEVSGEHQRTAMELTSRYEVIGEKLEGKKKELQENMEILEDLDRDCRNLSLWLEKVEDTFRHFTTLLSPDEITKLENCQMQILKKEANINSLKSRLQQLPQSLTSSSSVPDNINHLSKRWENAQKSLYEVVETCNEQAGDVFLFRSLHSQLNSWLSMKEKVISMCLGSLGVDCDVLENQSIQVELLKEEMKSEQQNFQLFTEKGHKIVEQSGSEEMYACIDEINMRWDRVQNRLLEKDSAISKLLAKCTPFYADLNLLMETCSASTKLFSDLFQLPSTDAGSLKDLRSKIESHENQQVHLKNLLEGLNNLASDLCNLVSDPNSRAKIQSKAMAAEKSYKDFIKYYDLVQKHLASKKCTEQKILSDLGDSTTWLDGILRNLRTLEEASLEPGMILSLDQVFQNLKESFATKKNSIEAVIKSSQELSRYADNGEFDTKMNDASHRFKEVQEKFESVEPKVKLISKKANQCIADIDKLTLWLELTNTKFLSSDLIFNLENLSSKLDEALHLKSEFDLYSVDLELIRNIINELNTLSTGAGSNMEQILLGLENVWMVSRKENETRLKILEESQDVLDELSDLMKQINSCLTNKEVAITHQSTQAECEADDDLEGNIIRLKEILTYISESGFMDAHEVQKLETNFEDLISRKNEIEEKFEDVKNRHEHILSNVEELLREVDVIAEDQAILEDCMKMNAKSSLDLLKLKQLSEHLEIFRKQNEAIESKVSVLEKNVAKLTLEKTPASIDLLLDKVKDLKKHSVKTLSKLEEHQCDVEDSITKMENLESKICEVTKSINIASEVIDSFNKSSLTLEEMQGNLKVLQETFLKKIHSKLEEIKEEKQTLSNFSVISLSEAQLDLKITKLNDFVMSLIKKVSIEEQKLQSALLEQGNFSEALRVHKFQLDVIKKKVNSSDMDQIDPSFVTRLIETLKDAQVNLNTWQQDIKKVQKMVDHLSPQFNENNRNNLLQQVNDLNSEWITLCKETDNKMETLTESLEVLCTYQKALKSFNHQLETIEDNLHANLELTDVESNIFHLQELEKLSEEVDLQVSHVEDLYEISRKIARKFPSNKVSGVLNNNLSSVTSRLEDVAMRLNASKERFMKGNELMKQFFELYHDISSYLSGLETQQEDFAKGIYRQNNYEELSNEYEPKIEKLKFLHLQLREFLSAKVAQEYADMISCEQAKCDKILIQAKSRHEIYRAKKDETEKLQQKVDELLKSVSLLKKSLMSHQQFSFKPSGLKEQLIEQKALHDKAVMCKGKSRNIISTLRRQSRIFEIEPTLDESIARLAGEVESCFKISTFKIHVLEQAYPLSLQFHETTNELTRSLDEYAMSFKMLDHSLNTFKPIRQQQEDLKVLRQKVMDQRFLLDRLNKTALALTRMFENETKEDLEKVVNDISKKFNDIKAACQNKINDLDQKFYESAKISDKIDDLSDLIESALAEIETMDSVPCQPEKIMECIEDIGAIEENVRSKKEAVELLRASSLNISGQVQLDSLSSAQESQDLKEKYQHMANVYSSVLDKVEERKKYFEKVLKFSNKFWGIHASISNDARQLEEHVQQHNNSFNETPPSNIQLLKEHASAIQEAEESVEDLFHQMSDLKHAGKELEKIVGETEAGEIRTCLSSLDHELIELRQLQTSLCSDVSNRLEDFLMLKSRFDDNIAHLLDSEQQLYDFCESSVDDKMAKQFLQDLYGKGFSKLHETHGLKIWIKELMRERMPGTESHLSAQINELKSKWMQLIDRISKRIEDQMQSSLSSGSCQLEVLLEELVKWSDDKNEKIEAIPRPIKGCSAQISFLHNQLQMFATDLENHRPIIRMTASAVAKRAEKDSRRANLRLGAIKNNAEDNMLKVKAKGLEVERLLAEAKELDENLEFMSEELERINNVAKSHLRKSHSKLSSSSQEQQFELQSRKKTFDEIQPKVEQLITSLGQELKFSKDPLAASLKQAIDLLDTKRKDAVKNLGEWKKRLDEAAEKYWLFEEHHSLFMESITDFEKKLEDFTPTRTTVNGCRSKIPQLQSLKEELNEKKSDLKKLEALSVEVKHASGKTEALFIRQMIERARQTFRNCRLELAKLLSSYNKALKAATTLSSNCSSFNDSLKALENKLLENQKMSHQNDADAIKCQMKQHQEFQQQLNRKQSDYDFIIDSFKSVIDKSLSQDQQIHNENIVIMKRCWNNLCQKSLEWQHVLEDELLKRAELRERIEALIEWLSKAEPELSNQRNLCGNLDFVTELEEEHNVFLEELSLHTAAMNSIEEFYKNTLLTSETNNNNSNSNNSGNQLEESNAAENDLMRAKILELKHKWSVINSLAATKSEQIRLSLEKANLFDKEAEDLMSWLEVAEESIKLLPPLLATDNEEILYQHLRQLEDLEENILREKPVVEKFLQLSNEILMQAHPDVLHDLSSWIKNFQKKYDALGEHLSRERSAIKVTLDEVKKGGEELEGLISWLQKTERKLKSDNELPVIENLPIVEQLFQDFELLEAEIQGKQTAFDKLMRSGRVQGGDASMLSASRKEGRRTPERRFRNDRVVLLNDKWKQVWVLMMDRRRKLQDAIDKLNKMEQLKNFDPEEWMERLFKWMNNSHARVINLFRKWDRKLCGSIKRNEFIQSIMSSNFSTTPVEVEIVADLFEEGGLVDYKQFASSIQGTVVEESDNSKIKNEIERLSQKCLCQKRYPIVKHSDGKYKFGMSEMLRLVRIQKSSVMVRVGGGWVSLEEFLLKNDPCRAKRKVSQDCREQFVLAEGVSQAMSSFKPKPIHSKNQRRHMSSSDLAKDPIAMSHQLTKSSRSANSTPDPLANPDVRPTQETRR